MAPEPKNGYSIALKDIHVVKEHNGYAAYLGWWFGRPGEPELGRKFMRTGSADTKEDAIRDLIWFARDELNRLEEYFNEHGTS